ncbi:MAG: hypothetical protein ABEJ74_04000 [Haloferacaceae archaeon]
MVSSRTATAVLGLLLSVAISVIAWVYFDTLFLFLFVPFVPLLLRRGRESSPPVKTCPECGFRTRAPDYTHCPRDGAELERESTAAPGSAGDA